MSLSKANPQRLPGENPTVKPAILPISPGDRTLRVDENLPTGADTRQPSKLSGTVMALTGSPGLDSGSLIRPIIAAAPLPGDGIQTGGSASESAAPTVRLTIGRIVVKAVPPVSSTPSAPVSRRQASVSLSAYLARHRRGQ
jgi:hypothetical protein